MRKARKQPKVKSKGTAGQPKAQPIAAQTGAEGQPSRNGPFPIVGIGASAGGLEAFTQLLKHLPADTGMGFVLVPHLDPDHESALAQILARVTSMPVSEVVDELRIAPNHVYIIPPKTDMATAQGVLKLQRRQAGRAPHHSIDFFFESLAQDQHECAIGVILSGTASDGTLGMEAIKAEGGITLAQDESAKYDSMPRSATAAGCVDLVLSPENIAKELDRIARHPYLAGQRLTTAPLSPLEGKRQKGERNVEEGTGQNGFKKILFQLRNHFGVDFSLYKSNTVHRRIARRMLLNEIDRQEAYANFLRGKPKELQALYSDMLIHVTSFFRNPEAFEVLKDKVFPKLILEPRDKPFRVWVPGCSTGQEAYSIAMSFVEFSEQAGHARKLQLFATDVNEALLDKGRAGLYAKSLVHDLSPERLRRFFVEENGHYHVAKFLRQMVIFARQNLVSDPPFSQMDLVACRNLLIYLEQDLQRKMLPMLHYALKPGGFLFLGESESPGSVADLFETLDKKHKIFFKQPGLTAPPHFVPRHPAEKKEIPTRKPPGALEGFTTHVDTQREADRVTVNRFAPPGVLIDAQLHVLQFRGETSLFLKPPSGNASFQVLKMAREGLMLPLRAAIKKAKEENKAVRREGVRVAQNGGTRMVNFEVVPLTHLKEPCCLIFFEEAKKGGLQAASASEAGQAKKIPGPLDRRQVKRPEGLAPDESRRLADVERALAENRDYTQSLQEQHEAANEELQASNEEVTSANEELQSINEELETSKEELESANEELTTVNDEMSNRNADLNRSNADLNNLHTSINLAILVLTRDLAIRLFNPLGGKLFNLLTGDVGRPLSDIRHNLDLPGLEQLLQEVLNTLSERELEVQDTEGRWYSLRVRPYLTLDNNIDGVVLVLADIETLKRSEREIGASRDYAEAILRTTRYPLVVLTAELRVHTANVAFYNTFKVPPGETNGRLIYEVGNGQWNIPRLRELLEDILPRNNFFDDFEVTHQFERIGRRTMLLNARRLNTGDGDQDASKRILLAIDDVTDGKQLEAVRLSEIRYRRLFESAQEGVLIVDSATHRITDANPFMTELLGYTREEFLEKELFEVGLFQNQAACEAEFPKLHEKPVFRDNDLPGQTKAGERLRLELVRNLYDEAGRQVIRCNIRDVTKRMEEQRQLWKINSELTTLIAELHRRDAEMSVLNRMHEVLQTCITQEEAYKVIASIAGELFAGQSGSLATLHASNGQLELTASWGNTPSVEPVFSLEDCWALRSGQIHEVTDSQVGMVCHHFVERPGTGYLCVPLTIQGETLGVLCFVGTDVWNGVYRTGKVRLAVAVGEAIKMSLSKLKLQEKLREQAIRDPLTGLLNRRFLEDTLARDLHRAQRRDSHMSVIMLDLDNFKRFNDTFGHAVGDLILRELARVVRETLRKSDIICRYGGDEFVLVLFDSPLKDSQKRAEQICEAVRGMRSGALHAKFGPITLSAGIAQGGAHTSDSIELLHAADRALYAAKMAGGDRVAIYQENKSYKTGG